MNPSGPFGLVDRRRRLFLGAAGAVGLLGACSLSPALVRRPPGPAFKSDPFTLGVASGYPTPGGFVLWTRLAPSDAADIEAIRGQSVEVTWRIAADDAFRNIVAEGRVLADSDLAHSVHVEPDNLRPGRDYWYRFEAGGVASLVGRSRTAPATGERNARYRIAFASCQQYEQGWFTAYRDMATQPLDLAIHLGDYIYESSWGARHVRHHTGAVPTTLPEFRDRYAQYKADPDLRAAHAAFPWMVIWDDHEVANDYTDDVSPRTRDPAQFRAIRAAAYQAWYEHMPVPATFRPRSADARIHAHYALGDLVDISLVDGRQYRSRYACLPGPSASPLVDCAERLDTARSMLGTDQETWLMQRIRASTARWSVVAQTTLMAERDRGSGERHAFWMDGWDGYPASRGRLLDAMAAHPRNNAIVLSGDVHAFWAANLKRDFADPKSAVVATEFVGGAITSEGASAASINASIARNPHLRYGRADRRGYGVLSIERDACNVAFRAVDDEKIRASAVRPIARFNVEGGAPGVHRESSP